MINTILFDLDGTLLPMNADHFMKLYFKGLVVKFADMFDGEKLQKSIWHGTNAMIANDGSKSNETVFWEASAAIMQWDRAKIEPLFEDFYTNDFIIAKDATSVSSYVPKTIQYLKEQGFTLIAATNPLFPYIATAQRIQWAGLDINDFALITTYETSHFCKPNPKYYQEILTKLDKKPEQCIMVGNDYQEDMCAETLGIKGYLIKDCLIDREAKEFACHWQGTFKEFSELKTF